MTFCHRCARFSASQYVSLPDCACQSTGAFGGDFADAVLGELASFAAGVCGKTARTFPAAFRTRSLFRSSMLSASRTESPCHKRAWPVYRARPVLELPVRWSAVTLEATGAKCTVVLRADRSEERTLPSPRTSPESCEKTSFCALV